jgi:biopolymer transport protein ExbD
LKYLQVGVKGIVNPGKSFHIPFMNKLLILIIYFIIIIPGTGCSPISVSIPSEKSPSASSQPTQTSTTTSVIPTLSANVTVDPVGTLISLPSLSVTESVSVNPRTELLIQLVKKDLSQKTGIDIDNIFVIEVEAIIWPDGSLGCGIPGTDYLQAPTPGFQILLQANGQLFSYHTNESNYFILCTQKPPVSIPKSP